MSRRKPGTLVDLEADILGAALPGRELHGYEFARQIDDKRPLIGHGTIYKALARLEEMGFLQSRWEDAEIAAVSNRPRRRMYRITAAGEATMVARHSAATIVSIGRTATAS